MDTTLTIRSAASKVIVLGSRPAEDTLLPPWMFQHDDLIAALSSSGLMEKQKLTNVLNYIHFTGGSIFVLLKHPQYDERVLIKAYPEPCLGNELTCRWDRSYAGYNFERYLFQFVVLTYEQSVILIPSDLPMANAQGLVIQLPSEGHVITGRQTQRFTSEGVRAELWQNGFQAEGSLLEFSPHAFRIVAMSAPPSSFHWFNPDVSVTIRLSRGKDVFFSGNCSCAYQKQEGRSREIVVSPLSSSIKRFPPKSLRNPRRQHSPPFYAIFDHPFTRKNIQREIFDISTSGFSIREKAEEVTLMPGVIIPGMRITYAGIVKIHCRVQVIYRKDEEGETVHFGMAILDMDLRNYHTLNQLLNSIPGAETGMANEVDVDELWELFFDTNFIYPQKYAHIHEFRNAFQRTYRKLYGDAQEIAKHFTYQKNGRIYSHVSLIRAYEQAWMIHHHAARPMQERYTGFIVLKQLIYFLNDAYHLPSAHMDYVFCFLRPENKFNERLYTNFAKENADEQVTSLDLFSYLTVQLDDGTAPLPEGWTLRACTVPDLWELEQFYLHDSGGLFWQMLAPGGSNDGESLEEVYTSLGFLRRWKLYALHHAGDLKAGIIAEESDVALNLSDLLNGFKVLVVDPGLRADILQAALGTLIRDGQTVSCPVMIYPSDYAKKQGLTVEKDYYLWILDLHHGNEYMKYLGRTYRMKLL